MSTENEVEEKKEAEAEKASGKVKDFLAKKGVKYSLLAVLGVSAAGLLIGGTSTGSIEQIIAFVAEIVGKLGF
jgi:hypothetical protein